SFNDSCVLWKDRLVPAYGSAKTDAQTFVANLTASGGTDMAKALASAAALGPQAIFLLTDGSPNDQAATLNTLRTAGGAPRSVHTIGIRGSGFNEAFLRQIATE